MARLWGEGFQVLRMLATRTPLHFSENISFPFVSCSTKLMWTLCSYSSNLLAFMWWFVETLSDQDNFRSLISTDTWRINTTTFWESLHKWLKIRAQLWYSVHHRKIGKIIQKHNQHKSSIKKRAQDWLCFWSDGLRHGLPTSYYYFSPRV